MVYYSNLNLDELFLSFLVLWLAFSTQKILKSYYYAQPGYAITKKRSTDPLTCKRCMSQQQIFYLIFINDFLKIALQAVG